jgi:hypothetical protein
MAAGSGSGGGTLIDVQAWATGSWAGGSHGTSVTHPLLADTAQEMFQYTVPVGSFPTYIVIDRDMVIQQDNMWPWNQSSILNLR